MKHASETGVYSLGKCFTEDLIFSKDTAPAIPYKENHFRKFFDAFDDILLSKEPTKRIIGFHVHYPVGDKFILDYGHWEILLAAFFFSLTAARIKDSSIQQEIRKYLLYGNIPRFDWQTIADFWQEVIAEFKVDDFLKLPDEELNELEKSLRPLAESAWEYTNCIDLSTDEKCADVIKTWLQNAYFMVVAAPDGDTSLQTAASMYGSYIQLMDTRIENLEEGWQIYE